MVGLWVRVCVDVDVELGVSVGYGVDVPVAVEVEVEDTADDEVAVKDVVAVDVSANESLDSKGIQKILMRRGGGGDSLKPKHQANNRREEGGLGPNILCTKNGRIRFSLL